MRPFGDFVGSGYQGSMSKNYKGLPIHAVRAVHHGQATRIKALSADGWCVNDLVRLSVMPRTGRAETILVASRCRRPSSMRVADTSGSNEPAVVASGIRLKRDDFRERHGLDS